MSTSSTQCPPQCVLSIIGEEVLVVGLTQKTWGGGHFAYTTAFIPLLRDPTWVPQPSASPTSLILHLSPILPTKKTAPNPPRPPADRGPLQPPTSPPLTRFPKGLK